MTAKSLCSSSDSSEEILLHDHPMNRLLKWDGFRGECKTKALKHEMEYYDPRVEVQWQKKAWTDVPIYVALDRTSVYTSDRAPLTVKTTYHDS
jgi:hypothetical protein